MHNPNGFYIVLIMRPGYSDEEAPMHEHLSETSVVEDNTVATNLSVGVVDFNFDSL